MIEKKTYYGDKMLEPEFEDVMKAKDLGLSHVVEDWPWGRKKRCTMLFYVERDPKRGERFVKQSRMDGRQYKPKKSTYSGRVKIVEIDGKIGHVEWHGGYRHFGINIEDGRYCGKTFFDDEAKQLAARFFGVIFMD